VKNSLGLLAAAIWSPVNHLGRHFCGRALLIAGLLLFFAAPSLMASGTVKGKVFDKDTKEALPGANVTVRGTSIGAASDLNGMYTILNVPPGTFTVQVSYVGYRTKTAEVSVSNDVVTTHDFSMEAAVIQGQEFVVTAQAAGQMQAINQQLTSNKIVSVVSEARIQELPDFNAAQAISRLPGISTLSSSGEANKIVIRGLAPKFNQITIGGISLASTGSTQIGISSQGTTAGEISNDRSVDLSMMSPYMIKTISVYKTLTPDMNANAIGGVVNMELREAPSELHSDLLFQEGYTQKSNTYGNYRAVGSFSTRFFDDRLGIYVLGNVESYDRSADNMNAGYEITSNTPDTVSGYLPVRVTNVQLDRHFETRGRFGGNAILDYRLSSGSIKFVNMFSRLNSKYTDYRTIYNYSSATQDLLFRYQEGNNNVDLASTSLDFSYDLGFMTVDLKAADNYSRNNLPAAPQAEFYETRGVGTSTPNVLPENLTYLIAYGGTANVFLNTLTRFSSDYKENGQTYKGDFKIPFKLGTEVAGYFGFGGNYQHTQHNNAQTTPYATIAGTTTIQQAIANGLRQQFPGLIFNSSLNLFPSTSFTTTNNDILNSFLGNRFGSMIWASDASLLSSMIDFVAANPQFNADNAPATAPGGWFYGLFQTLPNTYQYVENYSAGYAMTELNYNELMVVGGVRYEKLTSVFDAWNLKDGRDTRNQLAYAVQARPENEFLLPMVQAKYNAFDWFDIRAAYTQTLARPDYHALSPHFTISYGNGAVVSGNPDLRPAHAFNTDLIFTFHTNELGLLSLGGFYKEIKDFTYSSNYPLYTTGPAGIKTVNDFNIDGSIPVKGANLLTYINSPFIAYVRGVEVDLQTRFWYLSAPFNGVTLGINYTKMSSNARYPFRNPVTRIIGPRQSITEVVDSSRAGRLINQPNDIANAYVGYDYRDFSARVSFLFQGNAVSGIGNFHEQDGFTRDYFRIDASARQVLPWFGLELYLDLNNLNGENNASAQQSISGFTNEQNYGFTANLGLRFRLGTAK
jgi:TonB-dependent receptor